MNREETLKKIAGLPKVSEWIDLNPREVFTKNELFFREMIERRINHCEGQLNEHLHEAKSIDNQIIVWKGGRFSVPVWEALLEAKNQTMDKWSSLVWEQILRQMGRERDGYFDATLWDIASEMCMCCGR